MNGTIGAARIAAAAAASAGIAALAGDTGWFAGAAGLVAAGAVAALGLLRSNRALRRALQRRDEQLAHTAHELRTPLTSVLTALEMLRSGYATTADETAEFLAEADLAARHLAFLVNDVLDGAALTAGRLRLDSAAYPIGLLLIDAVSLLGLQAERRGIVVRTTPVSDDLFVQTDARRFLQVLFNLVGNAVKFSAPGQPVEIDVEATSEQVRVRVLDEGPGVPASLREHLFCRYARGEEATPGTGLGLYITRQLVEHMGGRIGYRPRPERGSEFWFELPRLRSPQAIVAASPALAR
jgi:signal transduction histidine kinase